MSRQAWPPRLAAHLARWLLSPHDARRLLHALEDEYVHHQRPDRGRLGADLWYWGQVLRSLPALRRPALRRARPDALLRDVLHLWRGCRRSPVGPGAAILTLGVALGAGTAIFSVLDAVLLTPPPFEDPDALLTVGETPVDAPGGAARAVDFATFEGWRGPARGLAALEAYDPTNLTLTGVGVAERVSATDVTPGFLSLLGVTPALGRRFDDADVGLPVAIISHAFWRGKLGGDPAVLGRSVALNGRPHTIIAVLPEAFHFSLDPGDVWRVLPFGAAEAIERGYRVRVMARLTPGSSGEQLVSALEEVSRSSRTPMRVRATPVATAIAGGSTRTLGLLAGAAALAMLLAFTNFAVLLLVRSLDRRRELAVRSALGAGPSEPARQLILEAVALVALGLVAGVTLALWITPVVARFALEFGGLAHRAVAVSWRTIGIVGAAALVAACVCGFLPSLGAARGNAMHVLRSRVTSSVPERRVRRVFVTAELALALVLLVSMALTGSSLLHVLDVDPGFDSRGIVKLQVSLPEAGYGSREEVEAFYSALQRRLEGRLGEGSVSMIDELPLTGDGGRAAVAARGDERRSEAVVRAAGPGYFGVMRIPVLGGRSFGSTDDDAAPPRAVISEALAQALFAGAPPVGRYVVVEGIPDPAEVVGVVGDVKHRALEEPALPTLYLSALQFPSASAIVVVRSPRPEAAVIATVRDEVERLDRELPVYSVRSMSDVVAASPGVPARRLLTAALAGFAVLAVLLAAIGVFGVTAHEAASRRAEFALRMALGAGPTRILALALRNGARLVGWGLAAGALLSFWAAAAMRGLLFPTGPAQLLRIGAAAAAALVLIGAAAVLPVAVRAARNDPREALQGE